MLIEMKRKYYPFILLELFLAIALISLSLIPIVSHPFKIYQNELTSLIEMQLAEISDVAFKDLLIDLPLYLNKETLIPCEEFPEKVYCVVLSPNHKWKYKAIWEIDGKHVGKEPFTKVLLQASLTFEPMEKNAPAPNIVEYEYFIEKKEVASHGKVHEADQTVPTIRSSDQTTPGIYS